MPVRHHYINGRFKSTDKLCFFYFPNKEQHQGSFFQYITPIPDRETLSQVASIEVHPHTGNLVKVE